MKTKVNISLFLMSALLSLDLQAQIDYNEDIQPIFNASCVSCHGGISGVSLENYDAVMNSVGDQYRTEIVIPGEPDQSPLVDKIEPNPDHGSRMPQGAALSDDQINSIRTWIEEGASEVAVSNEALADIPKGFEMVNNYPNPFNPQTIIAFKTPRTTDYNMYIYNTAGILVREISGITNVPRTQLQVNLNDLPSGIYIYRVKISLGTSSFYLSSKKMVLAK